MNANIFVKKRQLIATNDSLMVINTFCNYHKNTLAFISKLPIINIRNSHNDTISGTPILKCFCVFLNILFLHLSLYLSLFHLQVHRNESTFPILYKWTPCLATIRYRHRNTGSHIYNLVCPQKVSLRFLSVREAEWILRWRIVGRTT